MPQNATLDAGGTRRYDARVNIPGIRSTQRGAMLALLCVCAVLPARGEPLRRTPDAAFVIPWGDEEAALGFRAGPEMEPLCVQTWCVTPRGTLLVLDPVARRIKEFDAGGVWIRSWGGHVRGSSIECDDDGAPYVLEGKDLLRVPPEGPAEVWIRLPAPILPGYGQGLRATGNGLKVFDRGRQRHAVSIRTRAIAESATDGIRVDRSAGRVRASHAGGPVDLGGNAGTVLPMGRNADGTEILEIERMAPDGTWRLEVWFLEGAGDPAARRGIDTGPCDDVSVLYRRIVVAPDGTVYRARTTLDGFEIRRFTPREARDR